MKTHICQWIALFCIVVSAAHAQNDVPTHPVDGQFIKEWLVLGPFFPADLSQDFLAQTGGEANIDPKEGDTLTTKDNTTLVWKRYTTERLGIDLLDGGVFEVTVDGTLIFSKKDLGHFPEDREILDAITARST